MKKGLIYEAIKKRKVTLFLAVIVLIMGFYSYHIIPKQENPDVSAPIAQIVTIYPGASPEEVESQVTSKIEDKLTEIDGYDYSKSWSNNSVSIVILYLNNDEADVDKAWPQLRQKMDDVQGDLPEECFDIEVKTNLADTAGMIISLSGDNYSYEQLASYAENFKKELSKIEGVSRFDVDGEQEKEVKVEVDIEKLNHYALSLEDVWKILKIQNLEIPPGAIENNEAKINVKAPGHYVSLKDIENTIIDISRTTGGAVRLKDIANVYMGLEDSSYKIKQEGKNAVLLTGYFKDNKNIVIIGKDVREKLDELKSRLPEDVKIDEVLFQPEDVDQAVSGFILNLLEGIAFVVVVVFIGMGFKNAIVVSTAIPLSILMTFITMNFLGIKVHQISTTALIIALGILVDNAIVVSDAIQKDIDAGKERLESCLNGARQTAIPIFTSTLTTVVAFGPLLLLPGIAGEYLETIPQLVIISLVSSFLVAILVTPAMAYIFFKKSKQDKEKQGVLRQFFDNLLEKSLNKKKTTLLISLVAFVFAVFVASHLGLQFFPKADKNMIYIDIDTELASDLDKTEMIADQVEKILSKQEEVLTYTTAIGDGLPKFYFSIPPSVPAKDYAQILVRLDLKATKDFKNNQEMADYLQAIFDKQIAGGKVTVKLLEQGKPIGALVQVRVIGEDQESLLAVGEKLESLLKNMDGTINVHNDAEDKNYEFVVDVDNDRATNMGITKYDIQRQINIALKGAKSTVFRKAGKEYDILVKSNIESKEELENLAIKSSITGNKVLLKQFAEIILKPTVTTIKKYDREMAVTVMSDVKAGYSSVDIETALEQQLDSIELYGNSIVFDGEREEIKEYFGTMGIASLFAIFLIYIILLVQFNSFAQPLVVLITIPLSLVGSILGLIIFRQPLSLTALLGIISLIGLVVKNAILLIEFINHAREQGKDIEEACVDAVDKRFRPIILSAITTVMGLVPLVFSGSSMFVPMSVSLMSGLIVSTILTMIIIPVIYSRLEGRIHAFMKAKKDLQA